jgi:hypothetical protein
MRTALRLALAAASMFSVAACDTYGGARVSSFGNQVVADTSVSIPPQKTYSFLFEVYKPARYVFNVASSSKNVLEIYLATPQQLDKARETREFDDNIYHEDGSKAQFTKNLGPGKYALVIMNRSGSDDNVSYSVTGQEN